MKLQEGDILKLKMNWKYCDGTKGDCVTVTEVELLPNSWSSAKIYRVGFVTKDSRLFQGNMMVHTMNRLFEKLT